jgi:hypothetical protein
MTTRTTVLTPILFLSTFLFLTAAFVPNVLAAPVAADIPMGQPEGGGVSLLPEDVADAGDDELFGSEGGYFHPYISLGFEYTDNLYNLDDRFEEGSTENLLTTISPGVWFALPRKKIIPITINPNNSSPGGLQLQFEDYEGTDRFQAYALGGLDFKNYSEDSDLDKTDALAEGMMRYNMRGGLSLQLVDRYTHGQDQLEIGSLIRDQVRNFDSNFFMATGDWDITEKFRVQLDYINFALGYEDEINQFLDRVDNGFDLYGYFNYSLKTSFFIEYKFVDVAYDERIEIDNTSGFWYGGIKWDTTEKLALLFKLGYQDKKYDDTSQGQEDFDGMVYDFQLIYRFSEKTVLELDSYLTNEETDNFLASDKTVLGAGLTYRQDFSDRWSGSLGVTYEDAEYSDMQVVDIDDRDDQTIFIRPGVQYLFRDWLMFELAYEYESRESNDDLFDYDTNTFMFFVNFAL